MVGLLYTKQGKPLTVSGDDLFDVNGRHVGRRSGEKIYGPNGRYAGSIVGDTVVYRSVDAAGMVSAFMPSHRAGTAHARRVGSPLLGEEPFRD